VPWPGGAALGEVGLAVVALDEHLGWWRFPIPWEPHFLALLGINALLCGFVFLITWRIARRFGGRGLAVVAVVVAVIGFIREYGYIARFPEWGAYAPGVAPLLAISPVYVLVAYAPGVAPLLAISAAYVLLGVVGHGAMRLVAGPARGSPLARRPWEAAEPAAATDPARPVASRKRSFIAVTFASVCFLTFGFFCYYYVQGKKNADKPKIETVERTVIITVYAACHELTKQARKRDAAGEVIYSCPSVPFTIHARNRGSAGKVLFRYHFENPNTNVPHMTNWYHSVYFDAGEVKTVEFALPNPGTGGKSIYTVTVEEDRLVLPG
jgi:hypothetical protein